MRYGLTMREEESNNNDLDGKLRDYFRAEDLELETPLDLWDSIAPRLGEQRRPGWRRRLLAALISMPFWAPEARKALAVGMVLVVAVGLVYFGVSLTTDGGAEQPQASRPAATTAPDSRLSAYRETADDPTVSASRPSAGTETVPLAAGPVAIVIGAAGETLAFNTDSITAVSGSEVTITFNNPSAVNSHNFVVVQPGTKDAVAADGTAAGPNNNWVPPGDSRVVANTVLIGPGESGTVTFIAPAAGTYQFVCTFPGHNFTMFGDFIVN